MKRISIVVVFSLFTFSNVIGQKKSKALKTELDSVSYALGVNIAEGFNKEGVSGINAKKIAKGFKDFKKDKAKINAENSMEVIKGFMIAHQIKAKDSLSAEVVYESSLLDSVSYALGVNVSESFKKQDISGLSGKLLAKGYAGFFKSTPVLHSASSMKVLQSFMMKQQAVQAEKAKLAFAPMIEKGTEFLAKNAKRTEVTTLPSGLQYEIITQGDGEIPIQTSTVSTHYHGTLIDGTVFDSSVERGSPAQFGVMQVISGWTEALQLMPVGSKWKVYLPYNLAYGERGSGDKIKPYSTLIFEIELLDIVK